MREPLETADRLVELVADRAEAEAACSTGRSALTRFANSSIHQNVADDYVWARLRVAVGGRVASASTDRPTDEGLARLVEAGTALTGAPVEEVCDGLLARLAPEYADDVALVALHACPQEPPAAP